MRDRGRVPLQEKQERRKQQKVNEGSGSGGERCEGRGKVRKAGGWVNTVVRSFCKTGMKGGGAQSKSQKAKQNHKTRGSAGSRYGQV